eukprot:6487382-Prymnesium_polylepis.1
MTDLLNHHVRFAVILKCSDLPPHRSAEAAGPRAAVLSGPALDRRARAPLSSRVSRPAARARSAAYVPLSAHPTLRALPNK